MLLHLNSALAALLPQLDQRPDHQVCFSNLALARREGYHVVSGDQNIIEGLASSAALSAEIKAIYKRIASELTQLGTLRTIFEMHIEVVPNVGIDPGIAGIQIPVTNFSTLASVEPVRLIGENLNDCRFYRFLGDAYAHGAWANTMPLSCKFIPGGGADIAEVYSHYKPQVGATLAITDSDMLCPAEGLGNVARSLQTKDRETQGFGKVLVLKTKGIENIIPPILLFHAFDNGWNCELGRAGVAGFSVETTDLRFHADLKNGVKQGKILSWPTDCHRSQFWSAKYKKLRASYGRFDTACDRRQKCADPDKCDCWVIRNIGGNALSQALQASQKMKPKKVWSALDNDLQGEWARIGKTIVSWCCGMTPIFAT